jgi:hypothetical protein
MITIGSDPELFIFDTKTKKVVSAIDKIPGSKATPYVENLPEGFGLQTDNILAEFNIPPVTDLKDFIECISFMKDLIRDTVKKINPDYDILCQASAKVPTKELKHPQAKEAGCDPDFCIYTGTVNEPGKLGKTTLRSSGFHIHIGYDRCNIDTSLAMLHYIDAFVGIPSILYDTDAERRKLYGKAGCFRLCEYGFEYRTLSSYWIANPSRLTFIWNQIQYAISAYRDGYNIPSPENVIECINNNNIELAKKLIAKYILIHPSNIIPE